MRNLLRYAKAWALVNMISRLVFVVALLAFIFVGGEIHIQWGV
jgi:hypothetical protein